MAKHQYSGSGAQESTYRWIQNLRTRVNMLDGLLRALRVLVHQARERQVASSSLAAELEEIEGMIRGARYDLEQLHALARRANRRDVDRVEQPRKGRGPETNADVGRAWRDN